MSLSNDRRSTAVDMVRRYLSRSDRPPMPDAWADWPVEEAYLVIDIVRAMRIARDAGTRVKRRPRRKR